MTIVLQIYPNGEFTHGVDTSHKRKSPHQPDTTAQHEMIPVGEGISVSDSLHLCDKHYYPNAEIVKPGQRFMSAKNGDVYIYLCADMGKHIYAIEYATGEVCVSDLWDSVFNLVREGTLVPLGLSSGEVLKKTPKTRARSRSMTKRMARRIRNTAHILQTKYGHHNLSFLTLTLPNLSREDLGKCSKDWGAMVHKFQVWLRYRCERRGFPLEYVYCTEVQLERLEKRHEYALHLHMVFRGRYAKSSSWAVTPLQARKEWVRCIKSVLGHGNFRRNALENLQQVRKSAAGYLSKYLSKCCVPLSPEDEECTENSISINWGGYSRNLCRELNQAAISIRSDGSRGAFARNFIRGIPWMLEQGIVAFYKEGYIPIFTTGDPRDTRHLKVGVGRLSNPEPRSYLGALQDTLVNIYGEGLTSCCITS